MIFGPIFTSFLDGVVSDQRFTYFAEPMSASGHKRTSVTRLQMVRYSPKSGHWASVCPLSGVKRT